jgi:hypothetical protein
VESDRAGGAEAGGFGVGRSKIEERLDAEPGGGSAGLTGEVIGVEFAGTEIDTAFGSVISGLDGVGTDGALVTGVGKGGGVGCTVGCTVGFVVLSAPAGKVGEGGAGTLEGVPLELAVDPGEGDSAVFFEVNFAV